MSKNKHILEEKEYYVAAAKVDAMPIGNALSRESEVINGKISGLLTHISIMIAILSLFVSQVKDFKSIGAFTYAITIEIILYLVFAICCLRGLFITSPRSLLGKGDGTVDHVLMIVRQRRQIFLLSLKGTIAVTVAFLITLAEKIFLNIG